MKITIEEIPESRIAYFRNVGEYGEKQNKELMESFKKWAQLNGVFDNSTILGIPHIINKDFDVAEPAQVGKFSGGKYAVFLLDHTKEAISEFWGNILFEIEKNNLSIREQPIVERYTSQMIDNHLCEVLVPIQ